MSGHQYKKDLAILVLIFTAIAIGAWFLLRPKNFKDEIWVDEMKGTGPMEIRGGDIDSEDAKWELRSGTIDRLKEQQKKLREAKNSYEVQYSTDQGVNLPNLDPMDAKGINQP